MIELVTADQMVDKYHALLAGLASSIRGQPERFGVDATTGEMHAVFEVKVSLDKVDEHAPAVVRQLAAVMGQLGECGVLRATFNENAHQVAQHILAGRCPQAELMVATLFAMGLVMGYDLSNAHGRENDILSRYEQQLRDDRASPAGDG